MQANDICYFMFFPFFSHKVAFSIFFPFLYILVIFYQRILLIFSISIQKEFSLSGNHIILVLNKVRLQDLVSERLSFVT